MTDSTKRSVVMVCSQMPPVYGGAGAQAALLGRTLCRMGWKVTAVTLDQQGVGSATESGVRFRRILRGVQPSTARTRLLTTVALSAGAFLHIVAVRPSIVHIHGAYWWSILPAIAGRLVGTRVIVKLTRDGEDDARTVYSKKLWRLPVGRIYGLSLTLAQAVIVLNEHARTVAISEGLGNRVRLINNGVDDEQLRRTPSRRAESRAARSLSGDDRVVIFVGYLVKHKGILDLLHAWRKLTLKRAHLWLVGPFDGFYHSREEENDVLQLIDDLTNEGYRVEKFGHIQSSELSALYWAADVFTLPSYVEGMPNSLAEAVVAGCHVVASRIPGITDLMGAEYPWLVPPGDVTALTDCLDIAVREPLEPSVDLVARLKISHVAQRYEQLYLELMTGTGK